MTILRFAGLRAGDLPPLDGEVGPGLVALVGSPGTMSEVRRALVWSALVGEGSVTLDRPPGRDRVEELWGGTGPLSDALEAATGWMAGPALTRIEEALAGLRGPAAGSGVPAAPPTDSQAPAPTAPPGSLHEALAELKVRERELRDLRAEWAEVTGDVEQATMDWLRERQDAETQLQAYRDRARELRARLTYLQAGGPEAPCPTCGRPLADHLHDVRVQLQEEWESVVQDGIWWKRRREQLEGKPEHLRTLEGRGIRIQAAVETGAEHVERGRAAVRELETVESRPDELRPGSRDERALVRLAAELRATARAHVLLEAGRAAERITAGRVLWIRDSESGPVAEGLFHGGVPGARDRAAVDLAVRSAAARLARTAGAPLYGTVVSETLDALDPEDRLRAVDLLQELARDLGQVVIVTGTDVVELRPEAFTHALEIGPFERGAPPVRPLQVGVAVLTLTA